MLVWCCCCKLLSAPPHLLNLFVFFFTISLTISHCPPAFACLHTRISPSYLRHRFSSSSSSFFFSSVFFFFFFWFQAVILFSSQALSACVGFCFVIDSSGLQLAAFSSFSLSLSLLAALLSCFCVLGKHFPSPPPLSTSLFLLPTTSLLLLHVP